MTVLGSEATDSLALLSSQSQTSDPLIVLKNGIELSS